MTALKQQTTTQQPYTTRLKLHYGEAIIEFERVAKQGDTDKVLIKVHPDCRVVVSAPVTATDHEVIAATQKRSRWIAQQLDVFREQTAHVTPRQYISGESHYYLGKQYQLKVIEDDSRPQSVKLLRGKIEVNVRYKSAQKVEQLLDDWYRQRAKIVFAKRLDVVLDKALWVDQRPDFRILSMQTQWGSCSPHGRLTLNPYLVKAPSECIDYVILHELCHIAEHNHSERFFQLLQQVMPNWQTIKTQLDTMANKIILVT